jgi:hypothetical protein
VAEQRRDEQQEPEVEDNQAPFSTVYSNFALVSHTGDDLAVDFCLIAPPYRTQAESKTVPVPVIARVIVPPGLAQGLIEALRIQLEKQTRACLQSLEHS